MTDHKEIAAINFWGVCPEDGLIIHSRRFGDGILMGNSDGSSGVQLRRYVDPLGGITLETHVFVEEHEQ
jgi:septum formation inhibitor-activating ATPase MinD